jgi:Tol biopolymer transport system component
VANDTNNVDIFVKDMQTGTLTLVSEASDGTQGNGSSFQPSISSDGRYVAFQSYASNLVANDTNNIPDIFVKDTQTGAIARVSVASDGTQATGGQSFGPSLTSDGRYVAYASFADNLVAGDTNTWTDVFLRDMQTGAVTRLSVTADGTHSSQANDDSFGSSVSGNGRYVTFASRSSHLVIGDYSSSLDVFCTPADDGSAGLASFGRADVAEFAKWYGVSSAPACGSPDSFHRGGTGSCSVSAEFRGVARRQSAAH